MDRVLLVQARRCIVLVAKGLSPSTRAVTWTRACGGQRTCAPVRPESAPHLGPAGREAGLASQRQLEGVVDDGAGISYWQFYCRMVPGAIRSPQVLKYLNALRITIGRGLAPECLLP